MLSVNLGSILLPLCAALLYVVGALLVKRSGDFGVGVWRTAFISNLTSALIFQLLLPLGGTFHVELLWQPALVGVLFLLGQLLNYLALQRGDVSVATPVLGVKIILVALFTTLLLTQGVSAKLWAAAALSSLAIALLNRTGGAKHHHVGSTILYAGSSAAMFALFDVLVQKWSPAWGAGRFLPVMLGFVAVFSVVLIPFFHAPLTAVPRGAWPWLMGGCLFIGFQSLVFVMAIVMFRNATSANVLYSSRGLWSVVAVWAVGHWFANREQHLGAGVLRWRLAGAVLMMAAIALVLG
ncbi:MAG: DMT family transporter [Verrucomicrobia bacterium]|nr:DMT family transporter [Verrucomicrobiota bacterium]